jgi:formylglycine-generating enzyme required for sulfatase activity
VRFGNGKSDANPKEMNFLTEQIQNLSDQNLLKTQKTTTGTPNALDFFNMSGNVAEWTKTGYLALGKSNFRIPEQAKMIRGGGWNNFQLACEVATRAGVLPIFKSNNLGFRIVREVQTAETVIKAPGKAEISVNFDPFPPPTILKIEPDPVDLTETVAEITRKMLFVNGGSFIMGNFKDTTSKWRQERKKVTLQSFYLNRFEVSQKWYRAVMGRNPSFFVGDDYPVEQVNWNDATEFCAKISQLTGHHFRLPTEAEWEFVARNGGKNDYQSLKKDVDPTFSINYQHSRAQELHFALKLGKDRKTMPVNDDYNELNFSHMNGNVMEWCANPIEETGKLAANRQLRPIRGGAWNTSGSYANNFSRSDVWQNGISKNLGFRIAMDNDSGYPIQTDSITFKVEELISGDEFSFLSGCKTMFSIQMDENGIQKTNLDTIKYDKYFQFVEGTTYSKDEGFKRNPNFVKKYDINEAIDGIEHSMVAVLGGKFEFGDVFHTDKQAKTATKEIEIAPFYLSKYEMPASWIDAVLGADKGEMEQKNLPKSVSGHQVEDFLKILNEKTGRAFRLPSEAEWEFAAREGGKKVRYGNGKNIADPAEIVFNPVGFSQNDSTILRTYIHSEPVSVFLYEPNALGFHHLSGNFTEWCADFWTADRANVPSNGLPYSSGGFNNSRVLKGGGIQDFGLRIADRTAGDWTENRGNAAIRLAHSMPPEKMVSKNAIKNQSLNDICSPPRLGESVDTANLTSILAEIEASFVQIEGGNFEMGDVFEEGTSAENPIQNTTVSNFQLSKIEVPQRWWQAIMGSNPSTFVKNDWPVHAVEFYKVTEFITKLNTISGKNYRLPTETEWEFAAREGGKKIRYGNGTNTPIETEINFETADEATSLEKRVPKIKPVGSFQSNALCLFDMSGNVSEWCNDEFGAYAGNLILKSDFHLRVIRGGAWSDSAYLCRSTARKKASTTSKRFDVGFRLAKD